jgi:putative SOS response-associated peptidase YedK
LKNHVFIVYRCKIAGSPRLFFKENNTLVADIHNRMPAILETSERLGDEADPRELVRPYPAEPMRMWPISTRANKPENDDPSIVEPIELLAAVA